jgi:hypothetical protein
MKVNEIVSESLYDTLTKSKQAAKNIAWQDGGAEKYYADKRAKAKADVKTAVQDPGQQPTVTPEPVQTTQPQAQPEKLTIDQRRARRSNKIKPPLPTSYPTPSYSVQRTPQQRIQAVQTGDIIEIPGVGDITYDHSRNKWVDPNGEDIVIKNDVDKLNQRRDLMRRKSYLSQMDQPGTAT